MAAKATQTIPSGYKQTEVGLIPGDWEIKKCGELGSFYKGKGISSNDLVSDGLPCIMYGDIYVKFDTKFSNPDFRITKQTAANSSLAKTGDLFFTGSGETAEEIGKCVVYQGNDDIYIGGDIIALTPNSDNDSLFLAYMQNSKMLLSQKANLGQGHTVVHIYTEHIKSLKIPLPPAKTEQTAIASVLSDVDTLIEKLEKLVAKKRAIKQGTMQELLTGKCHLPGFSGEWEEKTIEQLEKLGVVKLSRGKVISKKDIEKNPGEYPIYSSSVHNYGLFGRYGNFMFDEELITWSVDGGGHFFYRYKHKYSTTNVCGFMRVDTRRLCYQFIALQLQLLHSRLFFDYTMKAHPSIIRKAYTVLLPKLDEQTAIAQVLSDMGVDIAQLEQKLSKYKMLKQGMMQVLLTGKIRLV